MKMFCLCALLMAACGAVRAQHVSDAPQVLEGPQAAGIAAQKTAVPDDAMTNDTVLRMHDAGLSDDLIVQSITAQPGTYGTSPDELIHLRQRGLSNVVLAAMATKGRRSLTHNSRAQATPPEMMEPPPVSEIGVYYKDARGAWIPMESESVHIKSGGFVKSTLTHNIIKEDRNGVVSGKEAKLLLPRPTDFLIFTAEGVEGSEYDLLRFRLNSKDREFRTLTGGVFHQSGGAQRDEQPFQPKRIAPRVYTFTVPRETPGGEYGILPPGTGNVTNGGKIYTFAMSE